MEIIQHILTKELFLIYLIGVMVIVGVIKEFNLFHLQFLNKIKDKRISVVLFSFFAGILPVPGRVTVSAGLLDTIATKDPEKKKVFGVLDYLATHHFYFWSPLEKTVILPMAALGLTWGGWMQYFWVPLVLYFIFLIWFIYTKVDKDAIELNFAESFNLKEFILYTLPLFIGIGVAIFVSPIIVFGLLAIYYIFVLTRKEYFSSIKELAIKINSYINWKLVILLAILLPIAVIAEELVEKYNFQPSESALIITALSIFMLTLLSGEEDVYAALNAVAVPVFGIVYLPLLWFAGYFAYSLSPLHKCIWISTGYFGTPIKDYYITITKLLGVLSIYLIAFYIFN
jgi:hypothetical protein